MSIYDNYLREKEDEPKYPVVEEKKESLWTKAAKFILPKSLEEKFGLTKKKEEIITTPMEEKPLFQQYLEDQEKRKLPQEPEIEIEEKTGFRKILEQMGTKKGEEAERQRELLKTGGKSFLTGIGDVYVTSGRAAEWLGAKKIGEETRLMGEYLREHFEPSIEPEEFTWKKPLDPEFWATTVTRSVPFSLSLIPAAVVGAYGSGAVAGAAGLGAFGTFVAQALGGAGLSRTLESAMEAGGTYDEQLFRTGDEEKADIAANYTFKQNMKLGGLDFAQFATAFTPLKFLGKGVNQSLIRRMAAVGGRIPAVGLMEAGEEGYQEAIQRIAIGEEVKYDPQMKEAMAIGGIFGVGVGSAGSVWTTLTQRIENEMPKEVKEKLEEVKQEELEKGKTEKQAEVVALDTIAETPEGKKSIEKTIEKMKEIVKEPARELQKEVEERAEIKPISEIPKEFISGEKVIAKTTEGKTLEGTFIVEIAKPVEVGGRKFDIGAEKSYVLTPDGKKHFFGDLKGMVKEIEKISVSKIPKEAQENLTLVAKKSGTFKNFEKLIKGTDGKDMIREAGISLKDFYVQAVKKIKPIAKIPKELESYFTMKDIKGKSPSEVYDLMLKKFDLPSPEVIRKMSREELLILKDKIKNIPSMPFRDSGLSLSASVLKGDTGIGASGKIDLNISKVVNYKANLVEKALEKATKAVKEVKPVIQKPPIKAVKEEKGKPSKVALSIEAKAIEKNLTKGFKDLAEYTPTTIKEQAEKMAVLMRDIEKAKRVALGIEPLPEGLNGATVIATMEKYALENKDGELMAELAKSPLVSETSMAGQTLRMTAEREPESAVRKIKEIIKTRKEAIEKKLKWKKPEQIKSGIKKSLEKEIEKTKPNKYSWEKLITEITC